MLLLASMKAMLALPLGFGKVGRGTDLGTGDWSGDRGRKSTCELVSLLSSSSATALVVLYLGSKYSDRLCPPTTRRRRKEGACD
jgi:hypothetical protein